MHAYWKISILCFSKHKGRRRFANCGGKSTSQARPGKKLYCKLSQSHGGVEGRVSFCVAAFQ